MCGFIVCLEIKLDKSFKFVTTVWHCAKNFACPTTEITWGFRAGANAKTSNTAFLFLVYLTSEYWSLVYFRSTWFIFSVLNEALGIVTGCLRPSPTDHLTVFLTLRLPWGLIDPKRSFSV